MTLLVSLALAQDEALDAAPCREPYLVDVLPAAGAVNVPVDARPALVWQDECLIGGSFQMVLEQDGEVVAEQRVQVDGDRYNGLARIPTDDLQPWTDYRLVVRDGVGGESEFLFSTGDGAVAGVEDPLLTDTYMETWAQGDGFALHTNLYAEAGADPDGLSVLLMLDADGQVLAADAGDSAVLWTRDHVAEQPLEHCVWLAQEDGAGGRSDPIEACGEPALEDWGDSGCSSAPLSLSLLTALFGLVAVGRRS